MGIFGKLASVFTRRTAALGLLPPAREEPAKIRGPMVPYNARRIWEPGDDAAAKQQCEQGGLQWLAELVEAMRGDGLINGLLGTRSSFFAVLQPLFEGDPWVIEQLQGRPAQYDRATGARTATRVPRAWRRILPAAEARSVIEDGIMAGAGIGYLADDPRPGGWRKLQHLDLHWLSYVQSDDCFYYQDAKRGRIKVTPGDGRWVLFTPYGRHRFWARGAWFPCARAFVAKYGANLDRQRWAKALADGLRYIEQGENGSESYLQEMVRFMREGWGAGVPGLVLPKGYKAGVVESSGKGYEVYADAEDRADADIQYTLTGNRVTAEGNKGFSSGDIFEAIANTLLGTTATSAAECITEEVLDPYTTAIGLGADLVEVSWDTRAPKQLEAAAEAAKKTAESYAALQAQAAGEGKRVKFEPFLAAHGVAVELEELDGSATVHARPPDAVPLLSAGEEALGEPLEDEAVAALAAKMTEHGVERCGHGSPNRCRMCGVERVRDFDPGPDGLPVWKTAWRPIPKPAALAASRPAATRSFGGLLMVVEHPAGSVRTGTGPDGKRWSTPMLVDYGRLPGTVAGDGEAVDAYGGPDEAAPWAFVVSQLHRDGAPDEPKILLGFGSEAGALQMYLAHVPPWAFGSIVRVPVAGLLAALTGR